MSSPGPSRVAAARRRGPLVWSMAIVMALGVQATPAGGQDDPPVVREPTEEAAAALRATLDLRPPEPASPDDAFGVLAEARVLTSETAIVRFGAETTSAEADSALVVARADRDERVAEEVQAVGARQKAAEHLIAQRDRLSDFIVRAYVTGGELDMDEYRALVTGDVSDPEAGRKVMFEQVLDRQEAITNSARLKAQRTAKGLVSAREALAAAEVEVAARSEVAAERKAQKDAAVTAHQDAVADEARAVDALRRAPAGLFVPEGVSLIGTPKLTAEDLSGWFVSTSYSPRVATPIEDYARWFIEEGAAEGIRGDIAFAQAVLETGGFANEDSVTANNFSGIGHCDSCASGWRFPSPRMGVRAQIQLLKSYAVARPAYAFPLVHSGLRGPAGCCPTWGHLTTVWATDPTYAPKVMLIYSGIVDHAIGRRRAGAGFDDPLPLYPEP